MTCILPVLRIVSKHPYTIDFEFKSVRFQFSLSKPSFKFNKCRRFTGSCTTINLVMLLSNLILMPNDIKYHNFIWICKTFRLCFLFCFIEKNLHYPHSFKSLRKSRLRLFTNQEAFSFSMNWMYIFIFVCLTWSMYKFYFWVELESLFWDNLSMVTRMYVYVHIYIYIVCLTNCAISTSCLARVNMERQVLMFGFLHLLTLTNGGKHFPFLSVWNVSFFIFLISMS